MEKVKEEPVKKAGRRQKHKKIIGTAQSHQLMVEMVMFNKSSQ